MWISLLALLSFASASTLAVGELANGPFPLDLPGATFTVPAGWTAAGTEDPSIVALSPNNGVVVIATTKPATLSSAQRDLGLPMDLGGGITLTPVGTVATLGNMLTGTYFVGGGGPGMQAIVMTRVDPGGTSLSLIAFGMPELLPSVKSSLSQAVNAARFVAVTQPAAVAVAAVASTGSGWANYLRGNYLVRLYTGSGYSEKEELWLCSDGSYRYASDMGGYGGGFSAAGASSRSGVWSARNEMSQAGALVLQRADGVVSELRVTGGEDGLYLNGTQWFRGDNELCR